MEVDGGGRAGEGGGGTDREGKDGSARERCLFEGVKEKKSVAWIKNSIT